MDQSIINTILLVVVAAINLISVLLSRDTNQNTRETNRNMAELEKNTNSKMDKLLASTAKAAEAEGHAEGLEQGRNESPPKGA